MSRVTDGTRTRDNQSHNLVIYQLIYGHHTFGCPEEGAYLSQRASV